MINELNEIFELGKVQLKVKNAPKDIKTKPLTVIAHEASVTCSNESQIESEFIASGDESIHSNPWRDTRDKENLRSFTNIEGATKKPFEKPRNRNHVPQVIDEDTEQFKVRLEHILNVFKTEATSEFMTMKRSMLEDQKNTIKFETEKYMQMYEDKCTELLHNKAQLSAKEKEADYLNERVNRMAGLISKLKTNNSSRILKDNAMKSFKTHRIQSKQKKYKSKLASTLYKRTLTRFIFSKWKDTHKFDLQAKHELKRSEEHRKDLDELVLRLTKENEMTTSRLNEALVSLDEANRLKQGMQENLRRAFMRGVCALNFEAMSVIQGPQINMEADFANAPLPTGSMVACTNEPEISLSQSTVQFHNQSRIETNDHKWKGAPLVGTQPAQHLNQQKQQEPAQFSQTFNKPMPLQQLQTQNIMHLVQQDDQNLDTSIHEEYEGKIIKVNVGENQRQDRVANKHMQELNHNVQKVPIPQKEQIKPTAKTTISKAKHK